QYALPEAVGTLRAVRKEHGARSREQNAPELIAVSGADPLNLVGILTPGEVVPALATNRILFRDGIPVAVQEGDQRSARLLIAATPAEDRHLREALVRRRGAPLVRAYLGKR